MQPNLVALCPNVSRVYEIAKIGNFTVTLFPGRDVKQEDINELYRFYNFERGNDMLIEVCFSTDDILNTMYDRSETLQDINNRIEKIERKTIFPKPIQGMKTLFKSAIEKLSLSFCDCQTIMKISEAIADASGADEVRIEHLAEAIQYKSYLPDTK